MGYEMKFEYRLGDAGWAEARISTPNQEACMTVSYLHDSLGELTNMLRSLIKNEQHEGSIVFMDEPGESTMYLRRIQARLFIEVRWYADWASLGIYPKDKYTITFEDEADL